MNIISISLTEKNLADLEAIKYHLGLGNISETIRATINNSLEKIEQEKQLRGAMNACLL